MSKKSNDKHPSAVRGLPLENGKTEKTPAVGVGVVSFLGEKIRYVIRKVAGD